MNDLFSELAQSIGGYSTFAGWAKIVGIAGTLIMFGIRIWRSAPVQGILKPKWRWANMSPVFKFAIPFVIAAAGTFLTALAVQLVAGVAIGPMVGQLIATAIGAGIAAMIQDQGTSAIGMAVDMHSMKKDPMYMPGPARKLSSLVIDIPKPEKALELLKRKDS